MVGLLCSGTVVYMIGLHIYVGGIVLTVGYMNGSLLLWGPMGEIFKS